MNEKEFLENDRVINFKLATEGSEPTCYNAIIEIKDKKIYVTGTTLEYHSRIVEYNNVLLSDHKIKILFRDCDLYGMHTEKEICEELLHKFFVSLTFIKPFL